jgi:hypothetical protein
MMLCGGGRTMEDIRKITLDKGMKHLCGFARLAGGDAIGYWLRKPQHLEGLKRVNEFQARQVIVRSDKNDFTMDVDATMIETNRQCVNMTYYFGCRAFEALLSFITELGGSGVQGFWRTRICDICAICGSCSPDLAEGDDGEVAAGGLVAAGGVAEVLGF